MTSRPTVSVCIPAYRSERFIGPAIQSVLNQTFPDWELVVVDDASPDGTADAIAGVSDPRLRFFRNHENLGATGNWNRVLTLARGRYIKVLCGDDVLAPHCLADSVAAFGHHPEAALVAGRRDIIDEQGRLLLAGRGLGGLRGLVPGPDALRATVRAGTNVFGEPAAVLLRADLVAAVGPFRGDRPYVIDLDYWCRMLQQGPLLALPATVASFRVSRTSWSVELARHQAAQTVALFTELHRSTPDVVSSRDLALGRLRARTLALARMGVYRALEARDGLVGRTARRTAVPA